MNLKNKIWNLIEYHDDDHGLSKFVNYFLLTLIIITLITLILETEKNLRDNYYIEPNFAYYVTLGFILCP